MNAALPVSRVSILMTIFNAESYLREAVESLISQSYEDWELIAIENGSTDSSAEILSTYSDKRLRVFTLSANIGRTAALRFALGQARGDYVAILDADDTSHRDRLMLQVSFLDGHGEVGLVGSWAEFIDGKSKAYAGFMPPTDCSELLTCLAWINPIIHSSAMFRRHLAIAVGGYPRELIWAQDFGLILALARRSKIAVIDEFLCQFRMLPTGMTKSGKHQTTIAREQLMLFRRAANLFPQDLGALQMNRRAQAIAIVRLGITTLRRESVVQGIQLIVSGLATDFTVVWRNGLVRRVFGRSNDAWWFRRAYGKK
jgi:glycosyltransferase involved in cell wall biosynthesis